MPIGTPVQTKGNISSASVSTLSTTIVAPASSSQLVVVSFSDALNTAITLSALTSQVWSKVLAVDGGPNQHDISAWLSTNPGTGTTVTMNNGSTVACGMVVIEFPGTLNSSTADGSSTSPVNPATGTSWAVATQTPAISGDVDVTWFCDLNDAGTITTPTGYTVDTNGTQSVAGQRIIAARKIKTDAAAEAPTWSGTVSTTHGFAGQILVKPATGGLAFQFNPVPFMSPPGGNRYG